MNREHVEQLARQVKKVAHALHYNSEGDYGRMTAFHDLCAALRDHIAPMLREATQAEACEQLANVPSYRAAEEALPWHTHQIIKTARREAARWPGRE